MRESFPLDRLDVRLEPLAKFARTAIRPVGNVRLEGTFVQGEEPRYVKAGFSEGPLNPVEKELHLTLKDFGDTRRINVEGVEAFSVAGSVVGAYQKGGGCVFVIRCFEATEREENFFVASTSRGTDLAADEVACFMRHMQGYRSVSVRPSTLKELSAENKLRMETVFLRARAFAAESEAGMYAWCLEGVRKERDGLRVKLEAANSALNHLLGEVRLSVGNCVGFLGKRGMLSRAANEAERLREKQHEGN